MKKYIFIIFILLAGAGISATLLKQDKPANNGAVKGATVKSAIFLDVRTDQEWQEGHLDGAIHHDLTRLQQGQLPKLAKDAEINIYCRSGNRAEQALQILRQNGYTNVRNAGGLTDLQNQGKKVCLGTLSTCN